VTLPKESHRGSHKESQGNLQLEYSQTGNSPMLAQMQIPSVGKHLNRSLTKDDTVIIKESHVVEEDDAAHSSYFNDRDSPER